MYLNKAAKLLWLPCSIFLKTSKIDNPPTPRLRGQIYSDIISPAHPYIVVP
jgi:hypothetical protein